LTEALDAISAAEHASQPGPELSDSDERATRNAQRGTFARWLTTLDKLPPIRLPIGPAIPWRLGLPALVAVTILMAVLSRSSAQADSPGVQLPAEQTYPVQQEAPLFAKPQPTEVPVAQSTDTPAAQPLGVQDPAGAGFDVLDIGVKLIAVLALAYGSLMLLKRLGLGGASAASGGGVTQGVRVVSSLVLAPNRSIHVIKVAGGRTLLLGATPTAVNLIADLGELTDHETPEAASFFDVLKSKVGQ
jgi:flagellar biogenesis protein FliO